jgi:1,4-dihydroxy-6-naphthoate synthase
LGRGCGPLLISKYAITPEEVKNKTIAIPGKLTTANFLLHSFFPVVKEKREMVFSEIETALLEEKADAGVIIHENRFTYQQKGLKKIADLGELWEKTTNHAIPLGGIAVNRKQSSHTQAAINRVMKRSVEYAWAHQEEVMPFVKHYSQAMSEEVMWQHIKLYVNDFTTDIGEEGMDAVRYMQQYEAKGGFIKEERKDIFVE